MSQPIASVREIADQFDGFVIDQFGVLHDGRHPYPEAVQTLRYLMDNGKTVVIVSNSGKRSSHNILRMAQLGFKRELYTQFVTSGDVAYQLIQEQFTTEQPLRCLLISRDDDASSIEDLSLTLVTESSEAQIVIIGGSEGDYRTEDYYRELIHDAALNKTPCLCTNPDKLMLTPQGLRFGAGRIAEIYELAGGSVHWIGKPYPEIYRKASTYFNEITPERILCIGDSLEHDVQGGRNAHMKTLFVKGGIHQSMSDAQLSQFMQAHRAWPDFQIPFFA